MLNIEIIYISQQTPNVMSKRGVSTVVATVLMVLLVIVGIAVIWAVIKPTIDRSSDEIEGDCFSVRIQPVKCEIDGNNGDVLVSVKRNVGGGDLNEIKILMSGNIYPALGTWTSSVSKEIVISVPLATPLEELASTSLTLSILDPSLLPAGVISVTQTAGASGSQIYVPTELNFAPVVGEQKKLSEPLSTPIECDCIGLNCPP